MSAKVFQRNSSLRPPQEVVPTTPMTDMDPPASRSNLPARVALETSDFNSAIRQEEEESDAVIPFTPPSPQLEMQSPNFGSSILQSGFKFDSYIGLFPTSLSPNYNDVPSILRKVFFVTWHMFAFFDALIKINFYRKISKLDEDEDDSTHGNLFWYVLIAYRLLLCILQCRHIQLVWRNCPTIEDVLKYMKLSTLWTEMDPSWGTYAVVTVRTLAIVIPIIFSLAGVDVFLDLSDWSFYGVLLEHYDNIQLTLSTNIYNISLGSTSMNHSSTDNGQLPKVVALGALGIIFSISSQVIVFCSQDAVLFSAYTIWMGARKQQAGLRNHIVTASSSSQQDERWNEEARKLLREHEILCHLSHQINVGILDFIQPSLMLANVVMMSSFLHSTIRRDILGLIFWKPTILRIVITFYFALGISNHKEKFECWLSSKPARDTLGVEASLLQIQADGVMPLGIGTSIFYMDTRFVASFCGIAISYFMFVAEAVKSGRACQCNCVQG